MATRPKRSAAHEFRALDVWFGSAQIMMHSLTAHMMAAYPPDVYVRPHVSVFGALEFWRVKEILDAADKEKDNFKRHLASKVEQFIMKTRRDDARRRLSPQRREERLQQFRSTAARQCPRSPPGGGGVLGLSNSRTPWSTAPALGSSAP